MSNAEISSDSINLECEKAQKFTNELWEKIVKGSLFSYQKTDICDYLLYLFDKHSGGFLHKKSNADIEKMLRLSISKIKISRKNIAVKFMDESDRKAIFRDFLLSLSPKIEPSVVKESENGNLEFLIENNVLRDILEEKLKKHTNQSFTYALNKEKLEISCENFLTMIKKEVDDLEKSDEYERIVKGLEKRRTFLSVKKKAKKGVGFVRDFVPLIATII